MELNLIVMDFFSYPSNGTGRNVIVFEVDRVHLQRTITEKKNTLIVDKGPTQGLEQTLPAEKMYSISFTENNEKFRLRLHYNEANNY